MLLERGQLQHLIADVEKLMVQLAGLVAFGAGLGEASIVFVPALVVLAFGVSSSTASFMLLPAVLAMAVGSPLAGRGLDSVGSRIVVMFGAALASAGMFVVGLLGTQMVFFYDLRRRSFKPTERDDTFDAANAVRERIAESFRARQRSGGPLTADGGPRSVADAVDLKRTHGAPDALRSGRLSRVCAGPEPPFPGLAIDGFVRLGREPLLRSADADPDDALVARFSGLGQGTRFLVVLPLRHESQI